MSQMHGSFQDCNDRNALLARAKEEYSKRRTHSTLNPASSLKPLKKEVAEPPPSAPPRVCQPPRPLGSLPECPLVPLANCADCSSALLDANGDGTPYYTATCCGALICLPCWKKTALIVGSRTNTSQRHARGPTCVLMTC